MKTVVRYLIAFVIVTLAFALILPAVGIPRGMMFPPAFVYGNAQGKTKGMIVKKYQERSSNPFRVGQYNEFVDIQFRAAYKPILFGDQKADPKKLYTGKVPVSEDAYAKFQQGMIVPVKYDMEYPPINGIDMKEGGQSHIGPANLVGTWLIFFGIVVVLAHVLSPFLERIMLRESY
ncbi:MAG: hypothetical protein OHK0029_20250 [Armatimonadaceae bacterium]